MSSAKSTQKVAAFLFLAQQKAAGRGGRYSIDAGHESSMPGVDCPRCGRWATNGVAYPTLLPKDLPLALRRAMKVEPENLEAWLRVRDEAAQSLPTDVVLRPGAQFGPLVGRFSGQAADFVWLGLWTVLIKKSAFAALVKDGFKLRGQAPKLAQSGANDEPLLELDIRPKVRLAGGDRYDRCLLCGRFGITAPDIIELRRDSYDEDIPIQRIFELPTYLVVSGKFKQAIERHGYTGSEFEQVALK